MALRRRKAEKADLETQELVGLPCRGCGRVVDVPRDTESVLCGLCVLKPRVVAANKESAMGQSTDAKSKRQRERRAEKRAQHESHVKLARKIKADDTLAKSRASTAVHGYPAKTTADVMRDMMAAGARDAQPPVDPALDPAKHGSRTVGARQAARNPKEPGERKGRALPAGLHHGDILTREYKGNLLHVDVVDDGLRRGFEWNGNFYESLTALADKIVGHHISGPEFFKESLAALSKAS